MACVQDYNEMETTPEKKKTCGKEYSLGKCQVFIYCVCLAIERNYACQINKPCWNVYR